ncbi:hypothetical protein E5288_WYG006124 [Bos mutus]|uniref:Uncharacterized protein n=1 Tax=Bos mutus TaxID=72004 RepID=A0A6B0S164_9CETA|nr:hypothetical protein [Bos mutus]
MRGKATSPSLKCALQFDIGMSKAHLLCCTQPLVPQGKFSLRFIGYMDRDEGPSLQGTRAHTSLLAHVPLHMTARRHGEILASCTHASGPFPPGNGEVLAQEAAVILKKKRDQKHCLGPDPKVLTLHGAPGGSSKIPLDSVKDHLVYMDV